MEQYIEHAIQNHGLVGYRSIFNHLDPGIRVRLMERLNKATLSYVFPAMVIVILLAILYDKYRSLRYVKGVLKGLHPAVAAMVLAVILSLDLQSQLQKKKL